MKEYLKIENFGPLETIELDGITPFTILIGESGSGKSTIMKVLSMFRWIYKRIVLRSYVRQANIKKTGIGIQMRTLLKTSQLTEYLKTNTLITYKRDDYVITYSNNKLNVNINIAPNDLSLEKICYISDKRSMIPDFIENKIERKYANYYLQDTLENFILASETIKQLPINYLNVNLKIEKSKNGDKFLIKNDEKSCSIQLRNASSGTQTVTPLSLIVEYYSKYFNPQKAMNSSLFSYLQDNDRLKDFSTAMNIGEISSKNVHLFIEEPELSLYPDSQKFLLDFLIDRCFMQSRQYNITLMLATHSPYIVNYLNVLMSRNENSSKAYIAPEKLSIYEIFDGKAIPLKLAGEKPIIDTRMMSDPISEIYEEYNQLKNE